MTFSKVKVIEDVKEVMIKRQKRATAEKSGVCVFFFGRDFVGPKINPNCKAHVAGGYTYFGLQNMFGKN